MSSLFTLPFVPALSLTGVPLGAATLTFYKSGTTTLTSIYDDDGDALPNPVSADAYGRFPNIYLDDNTVYRVRLKDASGAQVGVDVDPVSSRCTGNGVINLADWVVGDGTTVDDSGMLALAAWLNATGKPAAIHWGALTPLITTNITINVPLSIIGVGAAISQLICALPAGRLVLNANSNDDQTGAQYAFEKWRVTARGVLGWSPLYMLDAGTDTETGCQVEFSNCEGIAEASSSFAYAFRIDNFSNITVRNCRFVNQRGAVPLLGGGIYVHTNAGSDRANFECTGSEFYFLQVAANIDGHFEGVAFKENTVVACANGLKRYADSDQEEPSLWVLNNHFNCDNIAVDLRRIVQIAIQDNLFYFQPSDGVSTTPIGIRLEYENGQFATGNVRGNQFSLSGLAHVPVAIDVIGDPSPTAATNLNIDDNQFIDITGIGGGTGVRLDANTKGVTLGMMNVFRGLGTDIADAGNNTKLYISSAGKLGINKLTPLEKLHVGGSVRVDVAFVNSDGSFWLGGSGNPEGAIAAPPGSIYTRSGQAAGTRLYYKNSGSGNTGWVAATGV